jgi:hypothetical protein
MSPRKKKSTNNGNGSTKENEQQNLELTEVPEINETVDSTEPSKTKKNTVVANIDDLPGIGPATAKKLRHRPSYCKKVTRIRFRYS